MSLDRTTNGFERKTKRPPKTRVPRRDGPGRAMVRAGAAHCSFCSSAQRQGGRPPFAEKTMLRIRFLQQWFNL